MKSKTTRAALLAATSGLLALCLAGLALAAETSATVTVTGGALSISVPVTAGNLGTRENTVLGGTISGPLGVVQVSDARAAAAGSGWGSDRHLDRLHAPFRADDRRGRSWLHRRGDRKDRDCDVHCEQPRQPHRRRASRHRDRNHGRRLRHLEPYDQCLRRGRDGRRRLLRNDHAIGLIVRGKPLGPRDGHGRAAGRVTQAIPVALAAVALIGAAVAPVSGASAAQVERARATTVDSMGVPSCSTFRSLRPSTPGHASTSWPTCIPGPSYAAGSRSRTQRPRLCTSSPTPLLPRSATERSWAQPHIHPTNCRPGHR